MMILVATTNHDKLAIVNRMMEALMPDTTTVSLTEADVSGDVVEVGTIRERALQKATYYAERIEQLGRGDDFDAVLAIDDGLSVDRGEATPNSKALTDRILSGEWAPGTPIEVVRAFALLRRNERPRCEETRVPFRFLGNPNGVQREDGAYPLSHVLAPEGDARPVAEWPKEDENVFNLEHSRDALTRLFAA